MNFGASEKLQIVVVSEYGNQCGGPCVMGTLDLVVARRDEQARFDKVPKNNAHGSCHVIYKYRNTRNCG